MNNIFQTMKNDGYIVIDNFLPEYEFHKLNEKVKISWKKKESWHTRVKPKGKFRLLPYQKSEKTLSIRKELDKIRFSCADSFTYLYHALHESNDKNGLIKKIKNTIISKLMEQPIREIADASSDSSFFLTAFTSGYYLDFHTDCPSEDVPYALTKLLYFGSCSSSINDAGLIFRYHNRVSVIDCNPNRCVVFIPNKETLHGVAMDKCISIDEDNPRLAFSGWLLK